MSGNRKKVVITVTMGSDNRPALDHGCHVVGGGGEVIWKGAAGCAFEIEFVADTPDANGGKKFKSKPDGGQHQARLTAKRTRTPEVFKYNVVANGNTLDPYIIVDPA